MSAEVDRKEIDDKDGHRPSDEKVKDDQGDAEDQDILVEYMQEWIVEHDHAKNKQDEPGISPRQFASIFMVTAPGWSMLPYEVVSHI